jgi:hypothetical protein
MSDLMRSFLPQPTHRTESGAAGRAMMVSNCHKNIRRHELQDQMSSASARDFQN